ncbi:MAG: response regulator transcription factor [Promethearchaeota archaeon]
MDYRMPEKDGLLVAREILSLNPNCKIIFISADCSIKTQALNIGIVFFFRKSHSFPTFTKT